MPRLARSLRPERLERCRAQRRDRSPAAAPPQIFQTVGSGVKGGGTPGYACYGATKRGLPQLTDSLVAELTKGVPGYDMPTTPGEVSVHTLSPGMVCLRVDKCCAGLT